MFKNKKTKMKIKKILSLIFISAMLLVTSTTITLAENYALESITLDKTTLEMAINDSSTLKATVIDSNLGDVSEIVTTEWTSSNEDVASVDNSGMITALKEGTTTITVKPSDCDLSATCEVLVKATSTCQNSKEDEQNYSFAALGTTNNGNTTQVKLEWTFSDIEVSYKSDKRWDTDKLTWVEERSDVSVNDQVATFVLTNYSANKISANVSFKVEDALKETYDETNTVFDNNDCTIETPIDKDSSKTYQESDFADLAQTITVTLKFNKDKFVEFDATTSASVYGTYTVSIKGVKENQTAPASPTYSNATSNSLTVNAITTSGHGDVEYAVSTTNSAPSSGWQTSTTFTDLTEGTAYYFFARYAGDDNYNASPASNGANLGLGYTVCLKSDISPLFPASLDGNDNLPVLKILLIDGTTTSVKFMKYYSNYQFKGAEISINDVKIEYNGSYYFYNVKEISTDDSYLTYSENNETDSYTLDNSKEELDCDISITKVGFSECIDENSLITMADGTLKAMKDIEIGDEVLSIDYDTMTLVSRKVIYTAKDEPGYDTWTVASYYLHTFSDGTVIKRAMNHRFYCLEDESYEYMHTWENGEHTYKIDGTNPYLVSTEIIQEELHYCRITLEGSNNFFANGLATGDRNCCPNKVTLNKKLELAVEE